MNYPLASIATIKKGKITEEDPNGQPLLDMEYLRGNFAVPKLVNPGGAISASNDDLLVLWDGSKAGEFVRSKQGIVGSTLALVSPNKRKVDPRYFYYVCKSSQSKLQDLSIGMGIPHVDGSTLKKLQIPLPDLDDQKRLADYLDKKIIKIDEAIVKKKKLLQLLEEKRQVQISKIMRQGIEKVELKNSKIEWLGQVPSKWQLTYLLDVAFERKEKNYKGLEPQLLSLSYGNVITKDIDENGGLLPDSFDTYQLLKSGNIVLRLTDLQNDHVSLRVGYVEQPGMITSAYSALTAKSNILPKYLYYYLHAADLMKVFYGMGGGVRQSMKFADLKRLPVVLPDRKEQQEIIYYLDKCNQNIDKTKIKLQQSINLLEEYKISLISNAVTGKVKL